MKCFLLGVLGAVIGLLGSFVVVSQYSDYRAAAQTSGWIIEAEPAQRAVEANARRSGALAGAGVGVARPRFTEEGPEHFEVSADGLILMQGGIAGQLVVLIPTLGPQGFQWRCVGGSRKDVLACKPGALQAPPAAIAATDAPAGTPATGRASPAPPSCLVSAGAIGPLRLGASLDDARRAIPEATFSRSSDGEGVALVDVAVKGESLAVAYAGEEDPGQPVDMKRPIEHLETFHAACATAEGIHPGSTVRAAEAAYGPIRIIRRSEIESRETIEFERQPAGLQFRLDYSGDFAEGASETTRHAPNAKILSIAVSSR